MRIAFISNVVYPFVTGGAQKRIHEIGARLAADGHNVTIYGRHFWSGPEKIDHGGMTLQAVAPAANLYTEGGQRSITEAIDFAVRLTPELRRSIDKHDLIVASVFPYFPVLTAKLSTLGKDTPLITTWHEVWGEYWNEYLGHLAPFGKAIEYATARVPQNPVAVSQTTADRLAELGPDRDSITVVPNGIDADHIRSIEPVEDGFDILFAGRMIEDKNIDLLIEAFDQIATEYDATLGIIGDGPRREALERHVETCENPDRITLLGFLDQYDDVLAQMQGADVFASPSTREGFGITYIEAMAAGCIVIGATHPDSAANELIDDAGFLPEPTIDALADTLSRALSGEKPPGDPKRTAASYDWDIVTEQAEAVYRRAICRN